MTGTTHRVCSVSELDDHGDRLITAVNGTEITVVNVEGDLFAVANYCPHQAGPLGEGRMTGYMTGAGDGWDWDYESTEKIITCPWHSWKFDVTTGDNIKDAKIKVPTYDVVVRDDQVFIRR